MSTRKYFILKVSNAKVTDLWDECLSTRRSREIFKKESNFLIELSINNVIQQIGKAMKAKSVSEVEWNGHFPILCSSVSSQLSIKIKVDDYCTGCVELSLDELQRRSKDKETAIHPENKPKSDVTGSISLHLEESNAEEVARLAMENLAKVLREKDIEKANTFLERFEEVLPYFDGVVEVIDQLANLHSYLEVVVKILTIPYKGISKQVKLDKEITDLKLSFEKALEIIIEMREIHDPIDYLTANKTRFLDFVTQCSIFIQGYVQHTFLGRLIQWKEKGEIEEFKRNLGELVKDMGQAIGIQTSVDANTTRKIVTDIRGRMDKDERAKLLEELKSKLQPLEVTGLEANRSRCLDNTRVDELHMIQSWVEDLSQPNLFLLTGLAGTGKSTIARTVAQIFEEKGQLGAYIFFVRGKSDPSNASNTILNTVIQTIAYNLACISPIIANSIQEYLSKNQGLRFPSTDILYRNLLHEPLQIAAGEDIRDPILIVLDALDECGTSDAQRQISVFLKEKIRTLPSCFRFLVTSRPEGGIASLLSSPAPHIHKELQHNKDDVLAFIKHEMNSLREDRRIIVPQDWPWDENMQCLGDAADGLFIWAATAVRFIAQKRGRVFEHLKELLKDMTKLSASLYYLYDTVLENSIDWDDVLTKDRFTSIFALILFGKETFTDNVIDEILGMERGATEDILNHLQSLVMYKPGEPIRIHHTSLYDYLTSHECVGRRWYINPGIAKEGITSHCFEVMKRELKFNICSLETSFGRNSDVQDLEERISANISSSLLYSCRHWASHLRDVSYSNKLSNHLEYFALTRLLFWIEVLSLTGMLYACGLSELANALEWLESERTELTNFLADARNQINAFLYPISQSVPHIYMSFLPIMKHTSIVAMHYAKQSPSISCFEYIGRRAKTPYILSVDVGSPVYSISYSRDGSRIASGSKDGVCVWDAKAGILLLGPLQDEGATVYSVAFSANGERIVSGDDYDKITMWNAQNGEVVQDQFEGHSDWVTSIAFSPCGEYIASGSYDGTVRLWYSENGTPNGDPLEGHSDKVLSVSFSPDGQYLSSCSDGDGIIIWGVESRTIVSRMANKSSIHCIDFSVDSKNIVSDSDSPGEMSIWDVSTGKVLRTFKEESIYSVKSVAYSQNGKHILSGSVDGIVLLWDAEDSDVPPKRYKGHTERVDSVSFAPDGVTFATGSLDGTIKIWDVARAAAAEVDVEGHSAEMFGIACSNDGLYIVSGSDDGTVCLWRVENGECIRKLKGHSKSVRSVAFSSDNFHFASGSWDNTVRVWSINGILVTCLQCSSFVHSVAFSPDGLHLASHSGNEIRVQNIKRGESAGPDLVADIEHRSLAYSPDGKKIASGTAKIVQIWNLSTGELFRTLQGHTSYVDSVHYSYDGSRIVSGSFNEIIIWDAESGQRVGQTIKEGAWSVCFSPDGKWVASAFSHAVYLWNATSGSLFFQVRNEAYINSVIFLPKSDSKCIKLASTSEYGVIQIWSVDVRSNERKWGMNKDGWLTGNNNNLLVWIPKDLRQSLVFGPCIRILNTNFSAKITLSDYQGSQWTRCFSSFTEDQTFATISPLSKIITPYSLDVVSHIRSKNYYLYLLIPVACLSLFYFLRCF